VITLPVPRRCASYAPGRLAAGNGYYPLRRDPLRWTIDTGNSASSASSGGSKLLKYSSICSLEMEKTLGLPSELRFSSLRTSSSIGTSK
jgi:hypothetical protein